MSSADAPTPPASASFNPGLDPATFVRTGLLTVAALLATVGIWLTLTQLHGAVIGIGEVRVEENRQIVQHIEGGVIAALRVRNGDAVAAGQTLIELGADRQLAELRSLAAELHEMLARFARATAQHEGRAAIVFPQELLATAESAPQAAAVIAQQRALFAASTRRHAEELHLLRARIRNAAAEIRAHQARRASVADEIALVERQLAAERRLLARHLSSERQQALVERDLANLQARQHDIDAAIARMTGYRDEAQHERERLRSQRAETALQELQDVALAIEQLRERRGALEREVAMSAIRAPVAGIVHGLAHHTIGGVVRPGEPILSVVPKGSVLIVEAQLEAADIDQVFPGQPARVVFPAFSRSATPEIHGQVARISADRFDDTQRNRSFYTAEIRIPDTQRRRLGAQAFALLPGMSAEIHLQTGERTPLSYFLKPITDQLERALREE